LLAHHAIANGGFPSAEDSVSCALALLSPGLGEGMPMKSVALFGAVMSMATLACVCPGRAAGAVALGLPSDVARDGASIFTQVDARTSEEAKTGALAGCKSNGSQIARDLCKIVATFQNQCVAEALDPENGTPGFGWAMAQTGSEAKSQALANCRDTAGPTRQDACVVPDKGLWCDGSAK
jgi:hypothetical protein